MKHIDLFSGIGGFSLAAELVFGHEYENIGFCDNDAFCQAVIRKHWPKSKIYEDIKKLNGKRIGTVDLITGGFPCQPFSIAGDRKGKNDDRHLWPEMLRIIKESKPTWVIGENVAGLISMGLDQVLSDLEAARFEVIPFVVPACAVNAVHRRDRVWIIAYSSRNREKSMAMERKQNKENINPFWENTGAAANTNRLGVKGRTITRYCRFPDWCASRQKQSRRSARSKTGRDNGRGWPEIAARLCGVDYGLPVELDGFKLTKAKHREERIKSLGNAIVPQVAMEIMMAIKLVSQNQK